MAVGFPVVYRLYRYTGKPLKKGFSIYHREKKIEYQYTANTLIPVIPLIPVFINGIIVSYTVGNRNCGAPISFVIQYYRQRQYKIYSFQQFFRTKKVSFLD